MQLKAILLAAFATLATVQAAPSQATETSPAAADFNLEDFMAHLQQYVDSELNHRGHPSVSKRACDTKGCITCENGCAAFGGANPGGGIAQGLCILQCPRAYGCNDNCQ